MEMLKYRSNNTLHMKGSALLDPLKELAEISL